MPLLRAFCVVLLHPDHLSVMKHDEVLPMFGGACASRWFTNGSGFFSWLEPTRGSESMKETISKGQCWVRLFVVNLTFISMSSMYRGDKGTTGCDWAAVTDQTSPSVESITVCFHIFLTSKAEQVSSNPHDARWKIVGRSCLPQDNSHVIMSPQSCLTQTLSCWFMCAIWILLASKMIYWGQWRCYAPAQYNA